MELPKLAKHQYPETELLSWMQFINAETEEEFKMAAEKDPYIEKAYESLVHLSADERARLEYEAREKQIRDHQFFSRIYKETGYILDPHGACGYQGLLDSDLSETETGLFLETAHPAKFKGTVDKILEADIEIPAKLKAFMEGTKQSIELAKDFEGFKSFLMSR